MTDEINEFMNKVAKRLKKKPDAMKQFIDKLKDNWYDSIESLKEIDDETWTNELKFPTRLVKIIKEELNSTGKLNKNLHLVDDDEEEMIDTTKAPKKSEKIKKPPTKDVKMGGNEDQEQSKNDIEGTQFIFNRMCDLETKLEYSEEFKILLKDFYHEAGDDVPTIIASLKTLTKVIDNIIKNMMEPKFRSLNTTKKAVQDKLLKYKTIVSFLKLCEFEDKGDEF